MHVDERSNRLSAFRIYAACLMGCGALLALAGITFSVSTDMVVPAAAQADQRWTFGRPIQVALPTFDEKVHRLFPASKRPSAALPRSVVPVIISRVPENPGIAPLAEEAASPDLDEWASYEAWSPDRADTFRTVCVRLCDGAYFPISFATTRDRFKADAAKCKSRCGSPAKLFVGPPDGSADDLVDVRGSLYADLPNAFKYRTSYNASCSCKGQPWESAEVERHLKLAEATRQTPQDFITVVEGPAALLIAKGRVEITEIQPIQSPRETIVESRNAQTAKAVASYEVAEASVRRPALRSPTGRAATPARMAGSGKSGGLKVTTSKRRFIRETGIAATEVPRVNGRPRIAHLDMSSMQRPFRAKEYWRLSYWEAPNF